MSDIKFTDYNRITDVLMNLSNETYLAITLGLKYKNKATNNMTSFHSECMNDNLTIKRRIYVAFTINFYSDYENNVYIKPNDVPLLQLFFNNNILPWFMGNSRIFSLNKDKELILSGKYNEEQFILSDYSYLTFIPIICTFENGKTKEGIRLVVNKEDTFIDMTIDTFMGMYYFICNTDLYNAAANMMIYVKTQPYGENMYDMSQKLDYSKSSNNFFNKL